MLKIKTVYLFPNFDLARGDSAPFCFRLCFRTSSTST